MSKLRWSLVFLCCCLRFARVTAAPKRSASQRASVRASIDLASFEPLLPSTLNRQDKALIAFTEWLVSNAIEATVEQLLLVPELLCCLVVRFGLYLYRSNKPLYVYLYTLTALQHKDHRLKQHTQACWSLAWKWRIIEPTCHRTPLPLTLFQAMFVLACLRGWRRLAGCMLIAFHGPARIGEVLRATRRDLQLPSDLLQPGLHKAFLAIVMPKTRYRGGARVQHATVVGSDLVTFLDVVFGALDSHEKLYPFSASAFRSRWDRLLRDLHVHQSEYCFTPGSLRGGGAVMHYTQDTSIADLLWKMRLRGATSLSHYLQEVAALSSLRDLPPVSKQAVSAASNLYSPLLGSLKSAPPS